MKLSDKVKTALDELRMLILGGQILLGFQLNGVFAERFETLPRHARYLDAVALGCMIWLVALLVAPHPYHRIVERGNDSGRFHRLVTVCADLALLPFAVALALDVFIAIEATFGAAIGIAAAGTAGGAALSAWYAAPWLRAQAVGERERQTTMAQGNKRERTPLHTKIEQMLTEARVILPGAQALFGFQLAIVLTRPFDELPDLSRITHAACIGLVALSVILLMAPAAYHRIVYAGEDTPDLYRVGSVLVTLALLPLALGLAGDAYVVIDKIAGTVLGVVAASVTAALLFGFWYGFPLAVAYRQRHAKVRRSANSSG